MIMGWCSMREATIYGTPRPIAKEKQQAVTILIWLANDAKPILPAENLISKRLRFDPPLDPTTNSRRTVNGALGGHDGHSARQAVRSRSHTRNPARRRPGRRHAGRPCRRGRGGPRPTRPRILCDRRDLHPLQRPARRGARGRRDGALPLAPRPLLLAYGRSARGARAQPGVLLESGA